MAFISRQTLRLSALGLATTMFGGCTYADVNSSSYAYADADCSARYGDAYYEGDPYAYEDGYGYDCYDGADYSNGFVQIGFGGGWYDNLYYPGYGLYVFDNGGSRYTMRNNHRNYWGGRRAWWRHHGRDRDDHRGDGRRGRGDSGNRPENHSGGYGNQSPSDTVGAPVDQATPQPRQPGPGGVFQRVLAGGGRDRNNDGVPDRRGSRGPQNGGRGTTGGPAPVVAPAIQELPVPSPAPQAVRPGRNQGWPMPAALTPRPVADDAVLRPVRVQAAPPVRSAPPQAAPRTAPPVAAAPVARAAPAAVRSTPVSRPEPVRSAPSRGTETVREQ